jgi:Phospholipase A2
MASRLPGFHQMSETEFSVRPASSFRGSFATSVAERQMSAAPLVTSSVGLPIYGNYCGPGHGDPTGITPPIDDVDGVCRAHDMCYKNAGSWNCGCDRALITSMPAAIASTPSQQGKAAGALVQSFFSQSLCVCPGPPTTFCFPFWFGSLCITLPPIGQGGNCPP